MSESSWLRRYAGVLRWSLVLAITALSIWLLFRELDWGQVLAALRQANYGWVALGVLATLGTFFARAWRWQALLVDADLRLWPAMTALLVGQAVNMVLPARGGDLVRAAWIRPERGAGASKALGSVALEKVWGLVAVLVCGLILLATMPVPAWFSRSTWGTAATLVAGGFALWIGIRWQEPILGWVESLLARLPAGWGDLLMPRVRRLAQGLDSLRHARASALVGLWTAVTWGLGVLANWAVMRAFGLNSPTAALFLMVAIMVGSAVVPTPGRLGVFEGICVVSLALFDVPPDLALAVGLVLHMVVMGPALIAAALLAVFDAGRGKRGAAMLGKERGRG